ncbi:unnamed protein product [Notodromas monacha]|uniref:NADH dehydrogenase [ubiquinone] 1 beta subcomplex subunit 6 n=1 Tax=Notodromas monacha TaxID=399045 RepID=A0A7R9GI84_9CRUS|nr:unnamed protein product [Notodromas monacha]CAG0922323.1 unnamed protein product [Notodromas monacha]
MGGEDHHWQPPDIPTGASRQLHGTKPMSIRGRMYLVRERHFNMTEDERSWRAKWLKDQELSPREPVYVPEYFRERCNPLRRAVMLPLDTLFKPLEPALGRANAYTLRWGVGKGLMAFFSVCSLTYLLTYHDRTWLSASGWRIRTSRSETLPGDENFPNYPEIPYQTYANLGFDEFIEKNPWAERT